MKKFVEELEWRGMIHQTIPVEKSELQANLDKQITAAYIGFDPTASSLHIGNLATLMLLVHFQRCGHKPIALVGGATGMIGDPSGKAQERKLLDEQTLKFNQECIKKQLSKFLSFEGENAAEVVNNYDWFKEFSFLQFLREVGKNLTVNYMLAKDSVKNRLEAGISFTEFSYQLLQAYDFYHLNQTKAAKLQMGGSDQWGNLTSGVELIRRKEAGEAFALTCPLVTKSDGTKFGKSESGNVWLDAEMTSPYEFYQFWINVADADVSKMIRVFTLLEKSEIEDLETEHAKAPEQRILQKALAKTVTTMVHSEKDYEEAVKASEVLFGKGTFDDLANMNERTLLAVFAGVPKVEISQNEFENLASVTDLLSNATQNQIFSSKREARDMIKGGGVSINKNKVSDSEQKPDFQLLHKQYAVVQKGKKNYFLLKVLN